MSTIFNCKSAGNIQSNTFGIGGLIGNSAYTKIENCRNEATIECNSFHVGGIVGNSGNSDLKKCANSGEIKGGLNSSSVSGISGQTYKSTLEECYNTGNIYGNTYVSGIIGNLSESTANNCYNQGNITAKYNARGGIVGCAVEGNILNCYNSGNSLYGIIGIVDDHVQGMIKIDNCYYLNTNINSGENVVEGYEDFVLGNSIGKNIDDMMSIQFVERLNQNSKVWQYKANSYPILMWQ